MTNKNEEEKVPIPLIFSFASRLDSNDDTESILENSFYKTASFQKIPFYKPISLLISYQDLIPNTEDLIQNAKDYEK